MSDTTSERLRICFIHTQYHPAFSGHAIQLDRVRQRLRSRGVFVEVWAPRMAGTPVREYREGILVRRFGPVGTRRAARYLRALHLAAWSAFRGGRHDILHHAGVNMGTRWAIVPAALLGRKQVVQMTLLHADDPETLMTAWPRCISRRLYVRVDRWIALGTALKEAYLRTALPRDRLVVIPVGVDMAQFAPAPDKEVVRRRLGLPEGVPVVISVGDMVPRKGFDVLVEAVPAVLRDVPDALFLVVGPKSHLHPAKNELRKTFLAALQKRIAELGVASSVRFVGRQRDMPAFYQAADVMAFPSRSEGLPNAVMEAGAAGLPVVMADLPGISTDLVDEGRTGHIVPQEDPSALASRLVELLADSRRRREMGMEARRRVQERFDLERVVDRYVELYRALL